VFDVHGEVVRAEGRIRNHIRTTRLLHSPSLSKRSGASVYCKMENEQHTGSFKLRGAMNKVLSLTDEERARGVVTASTGNHGAAVAYTLGRLGVKGTVYVPEHSVAAKIDAVRDLGADVLVHGADCTDAEHEARRVAEAEGLCYVSPYNDPQVAGGQGTLAVELASQLDRIDAVFVSLGGGGLISGVAGYLKHERPGVRIVGCSPRNSMVMIESVRAGEILDLPSLPTLSDGTAGGVEAGSVTFDTCRALVDDYVDVTEEEIAGELRSFVLEHDVVIEGAAAVAIAALMKERDRYQGKNVVVVICGGNISPETLQGVMQ
jgi:threonine dehydratase